MKHASMNRIYRLVWNKALGLWVAVAENAKGASKGGSSRKSALALVVLMALGNPCGHAADALNASITAGTGSVATSAATTTINQTSSRLVVDWSRLSTTTNKALVFRQPNAAAIALKSAPGRNNVAPCCSQPVQSAILRLPERGSFPKELLALGIMEFRQALFKPYRLMSGDAGFISPCSASMLLVLPTASAAFTFRLTLRNLVHPLAL